MPDSLSESLAAGENPYGATQTRAILLRLFESASPEGLTEATEKMLQRIALLEILIEERHGISVEAGELGELLSHDLPRIQEATLQLAHLFYGNVAHREGG